MEFEQQYRAWANRFCLLLLAAHLPVLMALGAWSGSGVLTALLIGSAILVGPGALYFVDKASKIASVSLACSAMGISALLIHLGHGMIELHFHIFAAIAFLIVFGSVWPILAAAATIAVHHLVFWWILPQSVFNYKAGFGIVALHAVFVIFEAGPACWIALRIGRAVKAQSITTQHLKGASEQMLAAAHQVNQNGTQLSRLAVDQAATLEETSASSAEVKVTSEITADRLNSAMKLIAQVDGSVSEAARSMLSLTQSMAEISSSSNRVSQIIETIDAIAMQTNILALNAAVESARAGEAGAGFAVVADEVRALAGRCAQAAHDSAQLISESVQKSKAGAERAAQIGVAIEGMTANARQATRMVQEANAGGKEQAKGVSLIATALSNLEKLTQHTAANAEENAGVGQLLESQARGLSKIVAELDALAAI